MGGWRKSVWFFLVAVGGCNALAEIYEGNSFEPECAVVSDCEAKVEVPDCRKALACEDQICRFEDAREGAPLLAQDVGDCAVRVCDGLGGEKKLEATSDVQDDNNDCTIDDCDGLKPRHTWQESIPCFTGPMGTEGVGLCKTGTRACTKDVGPEGPCEGEVVPAAEVCDKTLNDEDCDGQVNEGGAGCVCRPGEVISCYGGTAETRGVGMCHEGKAICKADGLGGGECIGEQPFPEAETCYGGELDEDCDGLVNEDGAGCVCGDGYVSPGEGEDCDDGNTKDGDACPADCTL